MQGTDTTVRDTRRSKFIPPVRDKSSRTSVISATSKQNADMVNELVTLRKELRECRDEVGRRTVPEKVAETPITQVKSNTNKREEVEDLQDIIKSWIGKIIEVLRSYFDIKSGIELGRFTKNINSIIRPLNETLITDEAFLRELKRYKLKESYKSGGGINKTRKKYKNKKNKRRTKRR